MTRAAVRLPNFFVAGASKAGTTSLHRYLDQHPQVFMSPIKEPMFFCAADLLSGPQAERVARSALEGRAGLQAYLAGPQAPGADHFVLEWDDYVRLFRDVGSELAIGESSTGYMWLPSAAAAIRAAVPGAKIVFVLRDPADRLFTLYHASLLRDPSATFRAWFQRTLETPQRRALNLEPARYATHLQRFLTVFGRERLSVHLYEDYRADAPAVLRDIFAFLGVRPDIPIDISLRYNETFTPRFPRLHALRRRVFGGAPLTRWLPVAARRAFWRLYHRRPDNRSMAPADRDLVIAHYRDEIRRTADLIGRDLSAWLR